MRCSQAEELLASYLLGVLPDEDCEAIALHLDGCEDCRCLFDNENETLPRLAASLLPRFETPDRIKQSLFARIEIEDRKRSVSVATIFSKFCRLFTTALSGFGSHKIGRTAATLAVLVVIFGAVLHNAGLEERSVPSVLDGGEASNSGNSNAFITNSTASVTTTDHTNAQKINIVSAEAQFNQKARSQRYRMYQMGKSSSRQATFVKTLSGEGQSNRPRGTMFYSSSSEALLLALDLPPLPAHEAYQIWLFKNGVRYSAGTFKVDSTGYGRAVIIPVAPLAEFDAIGITIEPAEGSDLPTGTRVLTGEL